MDTNMQNTMRMKFKILDNQPVFLQVEQYLCWQIYEGELAAGQKLPTVRKMAAELTVNPNIVKKVLSELNRKNILIGQQTGDYFVTNSAVVVSQLKHDLVSKAINDFVKYLILRGVEKKQIKLVFKQILQLGV